MIRFDRTTRSTVAVCTRCGWRDVFTSHEVALRAAAEHEHGHDLKAAEQLRQRHARVVANRTR